jgi:hypothetical protein
MKQLKFNFIVVIFLAIAGILNSCCKRSKTEDEILRDGRGLILNIAPAFYINKVELIRADQSVVASYHYDYNPNPYYYPFLNDDPKVDINVADTISRYHIFYKKISRSASDTTWEGLVTIEYKGSPVYNDCNEYMAISYSVWVSSSTFSSARITHGTTIEIIP